MRLHRLLLLGMVAAVSDAAFAQSGPVVTNQIPDLVVYRGAPSASIDLTTYFKDPAVGSGVRMNTSFGELDVALFDQTAPKTVANFLTYVQRGAYNGSFIHRLVSGFIFQGGGYKFVDDKVQTIPTDPPVQNEFSRSNLRGTIAMAKLGGDPNSATSEWFFNLADNSALDNQNGGFTVFGQLADYSLPATDKIAALPTVDAGAPFDNLPLIDYRSSQGSIQSQNIVTVNRVTTVPSVLKNFTATGDNSSVATSVVQGGHLLVQPNATNLGLAHITVVATSFSGRTVSQTFAVNVTNAPGRPVNISTRLTVNTGENVLIGGFIITGNTPKRFLVRAIGPSLTQGSVANALQDPVLELHDHTGATIRTNDNWQQQEASTQDVINSSIPPTDPRESAILATLPPGSYTAVVRGRNATTGVGLVEIYDLDSGPGSTIVNVSTRGLVNTGENVLIGGFIIGGSDAKKILVRGIGPSLTASGVSGALADPTLEIHNGQGTVIDFNDNWQSSQQAGQIQQSNVAPSDPQEAATVDTLPPGSYTAIVRGTGSTPTGVALVDAYELN